MQKWEKCSISIWTNSELANCRGTSVSSELPILVVISFKFKWRGHNTFYSEITKKCRILYFFFKVFKHSYEFKVQKKTSRRNFASLVAMCELDIILISNLWERFDREVRDCPSREDKINWYSIRMKTILFSWNRKYIIIPLGFDVVLAPVQVQGKYTFHGEMSPPAVL